MTVCVRALDLIPAAVRASQRAFVFLDGPTAIIIGKSRFLEQRIHPLSLLVSAHACHFAEGCILEQRLRAVLHDVTDDAAHAVAHPPALMAEPVLFIDEAVVFIVATRVLQFAVAPIRGDESLVVPRVFVSHAIGVCHGDEALLGIVLVALFLPVVRVDGEALEHWSIVNIVGDLAAQPVADVLDVAAALILEAHGDEVVVFVVDIIRDRAQGIPLLDR